MGDYILGLVLAAVTLGYASYLLYIRLGSQGVPGTRVTRLIVELWATFALAAAFFGGARWLIGPVPRSSVGGEIVWQLERLLSMGPLQLTLLAGSLLAAAALFVHLLWSIRAAETAANPVVSDGGTP